MNKIFPMKRSMRYLALFITQAICRRYLIILISFFSIKSFAQSITVNISGQNTDLCYGQTNSFQGTSVVDGSGEIVKEPYCFMSRYGASW